MNYKSIRTILYESEEILDIPDRWQEALPIIGIYQKELSDIFIYFIEAKMIEIKRAIIISTYSGKISGLTAEEIQNVFGISTRELPSQEIIDYDNYFAEKCKYEQIYEQAHDEIVRNPNSSNTHFKNVSNLYKTIMGEEFYKEIYKNISINS